jgi:hypothetical protein
MRAGWTSPQVRYSKRLRNFLRASLRAASETNRHVHLRVFVMHEETIERRSKREKTDSIAGMRTAGLLGIGMMGAFLVACGSAEPRSGFENGNTNAGTGTPGQNGPPQQGPGFENGAPPADPPPPPPPEPITVVYGHSASQLYKLDPVTKAVSVVGTFDCSNQITDIAIDGASNAYATSFGAFYTLDLKTAKCTYVQSGDYPNSLSFVPKGTLDPNAEALVGYAGSDYVRIDPTTGSMAKIGSIGGGYTSSGDIVSVTGGGTFLTAKNITCNDCLLQIDPATGKMVQDYGSVGFGSVFGIAYWGGTVYGFTDEGFLFEITMKAGKIITSAIAMAQKPPNLSFWGAGSSTSVPVASPDGKTTFPVK